MSHHLVAEIDRIGEAFGIGPAMALDDDPVEAEEDAAIGLARIHLVTQHLECIAGEQITDPRAQGPRHRAAQIRGELPRGSLRGLDRDVAREAFGHDHVDISLSDFVAFDKAHILEERQVRLAQDAAGLLA